MRLTRRSMLGACAASVAGRGALRFGEHPPATARWGSSSTRSPCGPPRDRARKSQRSVLGARPIPRSRPLARRAAVCKSVSGSSTDTAADALRERALRGLDVSGGDRVASPRPGRRRSGSRPRYGPPNEPVPSVVRTVMLSGRRYETFATAAAFRRFAEESAHALGLAAPVVARHGIRLAVENHKDWRPDELLADLETRRQRPRRRLPRHRQQHRASGRPDGGRRDARPAGVHDSLQGHGPRGIPARISCSRRFPWARASSTCPASSGSCVRPARRFA